MFQHMLYNFGFRGSPGKCEAPRSFLENLDFLEILEIRENLDFLDFLDFLYLLDFWKF